MRTRWGADAKNQDLSSHKTHGFLIFCLRESLCEIARDLFISVPVHVCVHISKHICGFIDALEW